ncbi:MAG: hypothetical protein JEZ09_21015 [Salinivirgaceae bacterium]|nr:hypothetical protein [Salinivirgaceae bacterium]
MKLLFTLFTLISISSLLQGQDTLFRENFNTLEISEWTMEYVNQEWDWTISVGTGYGAHPPFETQEGDYNAAFKRLDGSSNITKFITPTFSLEGTTKPELSFYLAQYFFFSPFGSGNSKLSVYFRSPEFNSNNWVKLQDFNDAYDVWTKQHILLDTAKFSSVQLAFEGRIGDNEHGTCIDNINVYETEVTPKYLNSVSAIQAAEDIIPSGSDNNPILQLKFSVGGNDGVLELDSLVVTAIYDADEIVPENGVKIFATSDAEFNDTTQIGNSASFVNGKAIFTNINKDLPFGNTYVWVTYDIPEDPTNEFKGKKVDAKILINNIKVNSAYYPDQIINPYGYREINNSLFYDNFENSSNWVLTPEFEIDKPKGLSGNRGNPDPTYAFSGYKVLGTDITGIGTFDGGYELYLDENEYTAQTNVTIDATYYKKLQLNYYRWLNSNSNDNTSIELSTDGGTT